MIEAEAVAKLCLIVSWINLFSEKEDRSKKTAASLLRELRRKPLEPCAGMEYEIVTKN